MVVLDALLIAGQFGMASERNDHLPVVDWDKIFTMMPPRQTERDEQLVDWEGLLRILAWPEIKEVLRIIFRNGIWIEAKTTGNKTVLQVAHELGDDYLARWLVSYGAIEKCPWCGTHNIFEQCKDLHFVL